MDFLSLLFMLVMAALVWYWYDSLGDLELARQAGKRACLAAQVQFLDDTVAGVGQALVRDDSGRRVFRRTYRFEFSETGNSRIEGRVVVLGRKVEQVVMDPYLMMQPHEPQDQD